MIMGLNVWTDLLEKYITSTMLSNVPKEKTTLDFGDPDTNYHNSLLEVYISQF